MPRVWFCMVLSFPYSPMQPYVLAKLQILFEEAYILNKYSIFLIHHLILNIRGPAVFVMIHFLGKETRINSYIISTPPHMPDNFFESMVNFG